jgi:hypothetical protein
MDKIKINMIGGEGFRYDLRCIAANVVCTTCGHSSKYIDWVFDGSSNISFYFDMGIWQPVDKTKRNFAWLYEFSTIQVNLFNWAYQNAKQLEDKFEMVFTHDKRLLPLSPVFKLAKCNSGPWIIDPQIYPKSKLISMIASTKVMCPEHQFRQEIANKYAHQIDLYGSGRPTFIEKKEQGLNDYYFSIAMENANYPDVWSEKITDCFATGTIPIFWGIQNIGDFWNENGIIRLTKNFKVEDLSPELYYSKMEYIKDNLDRVLKMPTAEDYIFEAYLMNSNLV